jgi:hypothetical protein
LGGCTAGKYRAWLKKSVGELKATNPALLDAIKEAVEIGYALLLSPVVGFCCAAGLLLIMKFLVRKPELYAEPKVAGAPPLWIRGLLIFTSAGVSFAHGSNDGQVRTLLVPFLTPVIWFRFYLLGLIGTRQRPNPRAPMANLA